MKKTILLSCLLPLFANATSEQVDLAQLLTPQKQLSAESASSWCDGILMREEYQVCDETPIYAEKIMTRCEYQDWTADRNYSTNVPGQYTCRGPVYINNIRYNLVNSVLYTEKVVVGTKESNCQIKTRWVCEH